MGWFVAGGLILFGLLGLLGALRAARAEPPAVGAAGDVRTAGHVGTAGHSYRRLTSAPPATGATPGVARRLRQPGRRD